MKKDNEKQETYLIPEKGPEGSITGRTIVYKPGEWSERYNLLKAAAEDDPGHKRNFVDIELKDLKRDRISFARRPISATLLSFSMSATSFEPARLPRLSTLIINLP